MNNVPAKGGSIDAAGPAIADGLVVTNSGYALWRGLPATCCSRSRRNNRCPAEGSRRRRDGRHRARRARAAPAAPAQEGRCRRLRGRSDLRRGPRAAARAVDGRNLDATLLPELVDGDVDWRLQTHLNLTTHRPAVGRVHPVREEEAAAAADALAVRVQPGEFPPPGSSQPRAVRLHRGAGARERRLRRQIEARRAAPPITPTSMKLACVVHRFGADIAGGSEGHCRADRRASRRARTTSRSSPPAPRITSPGGTTIRPANHASGAAARAAVPGRARARPAPVHRSQRPDRRRSRDRATSRSSGSARTAPTRRSCSRICGTHGADYDRVLFWAYRYADTLLRPAAGRRSRACWCRPPKRIR